MEPAASHVLLATAVTTAGIHTLIPDHWLPFVLVGRSRRWSYPYTAAVSGLSALVHAAVSAALGFAALAIGIGSARAMGERLESASGVLLVAFGLGYALWAWRKGGHFHPGGRRFHAHEADAACPGGEGNAGPEHLHYHADTGWIRGTSGRGDLFLALIVGLNPCVLLVPLLLATAERQGAAAMAGVTLAYSATTVVLMVALSVAGVAGARWLRVPAAARYMEAASGLLIAALGMMFWLIER